MAKEVFIVGAKGISYYGGYESFVQKLLQYNKSENQINYHIACKANGEGAMDVERLEGAVTDNSFIYRPGSSVVGRFTYCGSDCFLVKVKEKIGSAQAIAYDIAALKECIKCISEKDMKGAIVYVLACRVGPFYKKYVRQLHKLGAKVYLNPDGHEWKRAKWSVLVRRYWKESERLMVKYSDLIVCDSIHIEKYICEEYACYRPKTTYISYGAEVRQSALKDTDEKYVNWLRANDLTKGSMYIQVGRLVPENCFETVVREFMKSHTKRKLVIIATENVPFMRELEDKYHYSKDSRIKFAGTVYDSELLMKIREDAYAYIHGHSVGGTNPSLLEALGSTRLNLLNDVCFNREVAEDAAVYWNTEEGSLSNLIDRVDELSEDDLEEYSKRAKCRIRDAYSWEHISDEYRKLFFA